MKRKLYILSVFVLGTVLLTTGCKDKITNTVVFDPNGGSGTMQPQVFADGEEKKLSSNAFVREDYNFSGWNTMSDGNGTPYTDGQKIRPVSDITLFAQWVSNTDTTGEIGEMVYVTFDANGGAGEMSPQPFTVGIAQALSANEFTRENYGFVSWNTASDGSGRTYSDTQEVSISVNTTLYAQWNALPDLSEHSWIDLGLPSGTKWATCNIGAANPEEYGEFFAWGEIAEKGAYTWESYRYAEGTSWNNPRLTKYCSDPQFGNNGFTDNLTLLEATDDAATANWGSDWRIPTYEEMSELMTSCTIVWTTINGVGGRQFTGPNGNSIFLPAAGYQSGSEHNYNGSYGIYWTSSLYTDVPCRAWGVFFGADDCEEKLTYRNCGLSIRAVKRI